MSGPRDAAKRLGELLQRQRLRARFSLEDASRRVGISVEMLSAIEGALAPMNWKVVDDLLNVYYSRHLAPTVAVLMREATSQSAGSGGPIAAERRGPSAPQKLRGILVSYRRSDEREFAGRIVRYLRDRLGPEQIFIDSDSIEYGSDFPQELDTALTRCACGVPECCTCR